MGSSLKLKEDSTFIYKTCGNLINGTWKTENDSLRLSITQNMLKVDSTINTNTYLELFEIQRNKLIQVEFNTKENLKLVTVLKKN